jgi:hypothetical protein
MHVHQRCLVIPVSSTGDGCMGTNPRTRIQRERLEETRGMTCDCRRHEGESDNQGGRVGRERSKR